MKAGNKPPETPQTITEFLWYCMYHADSIFVRSKQNGHWDSLALSEVYPEEAAMHMAKWLEAGHIPVRVLTEEEIKERQQNDNTHDIHA